MVHTCYNEASHRALNIALGATRNKWVSEFMSYVHTRYLIRVEQCWQYSWRGVSEGRGIENKMMKMRDNG